MMERPGQGEGLQHPLLHSPDLAPDPLGRLWGLVSVRAGCSGVLPFPFPFLFLFPTTTWAHALEAWEIPLSLEQGYPISRMSHGMP